MKLSAPVHRLKRKAKLLSRDRGIPLHEALDRVAVDEGYKAWSLLAAKTCSVSPADRLFAQLAPGDLLLVGARPGQGKTLISLQLIARAMQAGNRAVFFTLEYAERDVLERFGALGIDWRCYDKLFVFDNSDAICADHIIQTLESAARGTLAVIDYLQLLDQKRENPTLMAQIRALRAFARERGLILVFISQIDRAYDPVAKACPDVSDVRLPNPLDLKLFDKACFLSNGAMQIQATV